jgi:hypothetical protein
MLVKAADELMYRQKRKKRTESTVHFFHTSNVKNSKQKACRASAGFYFLFVLHLIVTPDQSAHL